MLVGDFNGWNKISHPLKKRKEGNFSTTITLESEKRYQFRYFIDGSWWDNDWNADEYIPNGVGGENSVVIV